uniref:Uncharacterized protein n=1 Tax=Bacillus subtilis subsp. natto TaxID=86029 RepID=E9RJ40_BACNA|nr:hypothetical protein [Bacillus subtilis subsp. natto]
MKLNLKKVIGVILMTFFVD